MTGSPALHSACRANLVTAGGAWRFLCDVASLEQEAESSELAICGFRFLAE